MLMLAFSLGKNRYAMSCDHVVEVVPRVPLSPLPKTPSHVIGLLNYRGTPCPVVDLGLLIQGKPCEPHYHTRVLVVKYDGGIVGLMAEQVTETVDWEEKDFEEDHFVLKELPFLEGWHHKSGENVQRLDEQKLIMGVRQDLIVEAL